MTELLMNSAIKYRGIFKNDFAIIEFMEKRMDRKIIDFYRQTSAFTELGLYRDFAKNLQLKN